MQQTTKYTYPLWFQSATTSMVVKFTDIETGIVVVPGKFHKVGYKSSIGKMYSSGSDTSIQNALLVCFIHEEDL